MTLLLPSECDIDTVKNLYLVDRHNQKYLVNVIEGEISFDAHIIWGRTGIGRIQCVRDTEENILVIGNIELFDQPVLPRNGLFSLHPFQRTKRNFRGLGLGSAMLKFVVAYAERLRVIGISGFITSDDAKKTPYLIEFYRKHGFDVKVTRERLGHTAATIYKEIPLKF